MTSELIPSYPRTLHLPWSPCRDHDDRVLRSCTMFEGREVVILEKMDGENTTLTRAAIATRSGEYARHPMRTRMRVLHAAVQRDIPEYWRVCGENVFRKYTIPYDRLPAHFLTFGIFNDAVDEALAWDEVVEWSALLGLTTVPVLWRGMWDEAFVRKESFWVPQCGSESEGYVVRLADRFPTSAFAQSVAKCRYRNTETPPDFMRRPIIPNQLIT